MTTLKNAARYFQLKQLETQILNAEENFKNFASQIGCDRETHLTEFRIIASITGRQTGSTERIVKLFNPKTDIYVGQNGKFIENFIRRVREHNSDPHLVVKYTNLNSKNLRGTIPNLQSKDLKRVWFDVGAHGIVHRSSVINCVIRTIEKTFEKQNPIYVIV